MQRAAAAAAIELSHIHVKVERLTDNAVRLLARDLGYIRRTLNENGEAYAETLERKYFEYFGFAGNASGRKCAAAMAAQLLGAEETCFAVFAACQEDCRLTVLDDSDIITHHLLLRVTPGILSGLGAQNMGDYVIDNAGGNPVVYYRAQFRRTDHATALSPRAVTRPESSLSAPWLEIAKQNILPLPGRQAAPLFYNWLSRNDH